MMMLAWNVAFHTHTKKFHTDRYSVLCSDSYSRG